MEPIIPQAKPETILTKDIDWRHTVVGIINGSPCILTKGYEELDERLTFRFISNDPLSFPSKGSTGMFGNGYDYGIKRDTPQLMVEHAIGQGHKVAVFEPNEWKNALQWLIDNA